MRGQRGAYWVKKCPHGIFRLVRGLKIDSTDV